MMPFNYVMRYYHPFPEAIPLSEAGCSRVTHPSATKNLNKSKFSVRLACVRRAASVRPEPGSNSLVSLYIHFALANWYPVITIARNYFAYFLVFAWLLVFETQSLESPRVLCFLALFNFQDTFSHFSLFCHSFEVELYYYITFPSLCQALF